MSKRIVYKSFFYYKKLLTIVSFITGLTVFVCICALAFIGAIRQNKIENAKDLYGEFYYKFSDLDLDDIATIKGYDWVDSYSVIAGQEQVIDDFKVKVIYADPDFLKFSNYKLIQGDFPSSENEIVVPAWYLYQKGYFSDAMIGAKVQIWDDVTNKYISKNVSGIAIRNVENPLLEMDHQPFFILKEKKGAIHYNYSIYVTVKTQKMCSNFIEDNSIKEQLGKYYNSVQVNDALLKCLGYTESGKKDLLQENVMYVLFFALCILLSILMSKNMISIIIDRWKGIIHIYTILGADLLEINRIMRNVIMTCVGIGELLGIVISIMVLSFCLPFAIANVHSKYVFVIMLVAAEFVCSYIPLCIVKKQKKINLATKIYSTIFARRFGNYVKYSMRSFTFYNKKKWYNIMVISMCIIIVFTIKMQSAQNLKVYENNNKYQYYISVKDYFSLWTWGTDEDIEQVKECVEDIEKYCAEKSIPMYYSDFYVSDFYLSVENMSTALIDNLSQTASGAANLYGKGGGIKVPLCVIGCSTDWFTDMGVQVPQSESEGVLLSRLTNISDTDAKNITIQKGETIPLDTLLYNENGSESDTLQVKIVDKVDSLSMYPTTSENAMCLVMNIKDYNHFFNMDFVSSFYLGDTAIKEIEQIQQIASRTEFVQVLDQHEIVSATKHIEKVNKMLLNAVLIMCCAYCFFNIRVQKRLEYALRKKENLLLLHLGIPRKVLWKLNCLESGFIFVLGGILGMGGTIIIYGILYELGAVHSWGYASTFAVESLFIIMIFVVLSIAFDAAKYSSIVKNID